MIKAVLFDLDGVLIETEKEMFGYYQEYFRPLGIIIPDDAIRYKAGRKSVEFFNDILTEEQRKKIDIQKVIDERRDLYNTYPERYVTRVEGVEEILQFLKSQGFRLALVSQNELRMVNSMMDWLKIRNYFEVILSLENIRYKKPHPEIYLLAAKKMRLEPKDCLAVEDAKNGVESVKNAGMLCVGYYHDYMPENALEKADFIIKNLMDIKKVISQIK